MAIFRESFFRAAALTSWMPIYEYQCRRCEHVFEELILRSSDEAELACPSCKADEPQRILSASTVSTGGGSGGGGGCVPRGGFS